MKDFNYYAPTEVVFGEQSEEQVAALVKKYGGTKVLVHYGGQSAVRSGLLDKICGLLKEGGVEYVTLGGVVPNPRLSLAQKGIEIAEPADIIRDPYVFEFLGLPEDKPVMESDLERALVQQIEKFLLELGRGFMFVGTQQRVTVNNTHYYVDMVFYNKILRAYVLIELKSGKLTPEAAGQINLYLNYYAAEVNDPDDNPPIGIILCTDKDSITAEYALGGLSNHIFTSRYVLYMPDKKQLIAQVESVVNKWHDN